MSIGEIFTKERDRYVQHFVEARSKICRDFPRSVGELLISINDEELRFPYRYLRVDVMSKFQDGSSRATKIELNLDPTFKASAFDCGSFAVELHPFTWDSVQLLVNKPIKDTKQLEGWITHWLDIEDKNPKNHLDLSQAVHSFSPVDHEGRWWYLTGDFGSAPADALSECVELLADQGMTRIVLKSGNADI